MNPTSANVNKVIQLYRAVDLGANDAGGYRCFQITIAHAGGNRIKTVYGRKAALAIAFGQAQLGQHVRVKDLKSKKLIFRSDQPTVRRERLAA